MENKYNNSKIYMIWSILGDDKYYGSTTQKLSIRMCGHKTSYKKGIKNISSYILFEKYGIDNCKIELVLNYPCNSKEELNKKEGEYIRNNQCVNKQIAGRTHKIYYEENKDKIKEYQKEWFFDNKERIREYKETNKEKTSEKNKEYYKANKAKILQYQKEYREANKE